MQTKELIIGIQKLTVRKRVYFIEPLLHPVRKVTEVDRKLKPSHELQED